MTPVQPHELQKVINDTNFIVQKLHTLVGENDLHALKDRIKDTLDDIVDLTNPDVEDNTDTLQIGYNELIAWAILAKVTLNRKSIKGQIQDALDNPFNTYALALQSIQNHFYSYIHSNSLLNENPDRKQRINDIANNIKNLLDEIIKLAKISNMLKDED